MLYQPPLPPRYAAYSQDELRRRIAERKAEFGRRIVILGHHYQQDDVIEFADFTGDSFKLSQLAAAQKDAEFVIFCGVHFMAESADILTDERVKVILPDLSAGCSMADMAGIEQVEEAWDWLTGVADATIIPITYVNSSAAVKGFVGGHGGACCTSSNARAVLEWALAGSTPSAPNVNRKVIFLPDQHLGRNTAYDMGWPLESMVVYDPKQAQGGLTAEQVRAATFLLWKGHCSVHQLFTAKQVEDIRAADPAYNVIVHPECDWSVVQKADMAGSTEFILKTIDAAPAGSKWAVGTEVHLVHRLAKRYEGVKTVRLLAGIQCLCTTMYRIDLKHLLFALDELAVGRVTNQIRVDSETRTLARLALDRMLSLVGTGNAKAAATVD
ncbi:MAG: quinolinate synthase A [Phycisphaerae bacterium]|nr:MAG: quinolinate synthase NadA [Planctomycetia bacterium]RIK70144.1 MAG: quinolinate synthase [Planctomycetota bacterium]GJQ26604.1 MAG: quinolinate synthase A [Phycisphaerae bacterium]